MTLDPVLPLPALGAIAVALIALRLVTLRPAAGSGGKALLRWGATTLALLLVLVAAARPGTGPTAEATAPTTGRGGENVYFIVDRSADSAIDDFGGASRMSGIRDDIGALIRSHPDARFAVVSFASRPAVDWPLSNDAWSLEPVIDALNPYPVADGGAGDQVNAAAAANVLRYQLISAGQQYPRSENLVYYLGSGAPGSDAPQGVFDTPGVDGGAVFGYGAGPDDGRLRGIADQLGVPFVQRVAGEPLPQAAAPTTEPTVSAQDMPERDEWYWMFAMIASILLLGEIYLSIRELRRSRATYREASR